MSSEDVVKDFQVLNAGVKEDKEEVDTSRQERSENRNIKQLRKDIVDFILIVLDLTDSSNSVIVYPKGS